MNAHDALRRMVGDYPGGIEAIAPRLGKSVSTLDKELRQAKGYKLGITTACMISQFCHEAGIETARAYATSVAQHCGGEVALSQASIAAGGDVTQDTGRVLREVSDVVAEVTSAGVDKRYSANEVKRIEREASEAIAAIQRLVADVQSVHQAGQPRSTSRTGG